MSNYKDIYNFGDRCIMYTIIVYIIWIEIDKSINLNSVKSKNP